MSYGPIVGTRSRPPSWGEIQVRPGARGALHYDTGYLEEPHPYGYWRGREFGPEPTAPETRHYVGVSQLTPA